jgi:hypothetical protein
MIQLFDQVDIIIDDETLLVTREGETVWKDGKPFKREIIEFPITCNVQPLNGRDLQMVPEGDRYKEQYWVFMNQEQKPVQTNDKVVRPGVLQNSKPAKVLFQVQEVQNWGSFTQARIVRIDVGPDANANY